MENLVPEFPSLMLPVWSSSTCRSGIKWGETEVPASAQAQAACLRPTADAPSPQPASADQCHLPECGLSGGHHDPPGGGGRFPGLLVTVPICSVGRQGGAPCPLFWVFAATFSSSPPVSCLLSPCHPTPYSRLSAPEPTGGETPRPQHWCISVRKGGQV